MTPKEKAKELVDKFFEYSDSADEFRFAVKCALIAVDEILTNVKFLAEYDYKFYSEVKQEIEKL